jgi:hypothetical protein
LLLPAGVVWGLEGLVRVVLFGVFDPRVRAKELDHFREFAAFDLGDEEALFSGVDAVEPEVEAAELALDRALVLIRGVVVKVDEDLQRELIRLVVGEGERGKDHREPEETQVLHALVILTRAKPTSDLGRPLSHLSTAGEP